MRFEPYSDLYFAVTGIDDYNKIPIKDQSELHSVLTRGQNLKGSAKNCSFQREGGRQYARIDHDDIPYYELMNCDTFFFDNRDYIGHHWIVCNILTVEWRNPSCSFVWFKVDYFMTYQTLCDLNNTVAYIEREHVKEDWASDGGNPLFSNMGPAEDFGTQPDTPIYTWTKNYKPTSVLVHSPYDSSGNAVFDGNIAGNMYSSLQSILFGATAANTYFNTIAEKKEASINNIVNVFGCPTEFGAVAVNGQPIEEDETLIPINEAAKQLKDPYVFNNAKCFSSPFFNIRLMASSGATIDFTPQWFGSDIDEYTIKIKITGAGGQFGGAACTFENKNGTFDWKAWNDFVVMIDSLPSCPWTGDGFTDWKSVNMKTTLSNARGEYARAFLGGIRGLAGGAANASENPTAAIANSAVSGVESGINMAQVMNNLEQTINQVKATGATVSGVGAFNNLFDIGNESWGFKVVYYASQKYAMFSVDAYFDRFGYRINKLKPLGLKNRPYWTFIKTAECHVNAGQGLPYIAGLAINAMFNHGVTMWNPDKYIAGHDIGDFSKAKENRGIRGGP